LHPHYQEDVPYTPEEEKARDAEERAGAEKALVERADAERVAGVRKSRIRKLMALGLTLEEAEGR